MSSPHQRTIVLFILHINTNSYYQSKINKYLRTINQISLSLSLSLSHTPTHTHTTNQIVQLIHSIPNWGKGTQKKKISLMHNQIPANQTRTNSKLVVAEQTRFWFNHQLNTVKWTIRFELLYIHHLSCILEVLLFLHKAQDALEQSKILIEHQIVGNTQSEIIKK